MKSDIVETDNESYDPQSSRLTPRDKIEAINKEITVLEKYVTDLLNHSIKDIYDLREFQTKIKTLNFAYTNFINETNQDIMEILEDCPSFKTFFRLWLKDMKEDTPEEKLERWIRFRAKSSGKLSESLNQLVSSMSKLVAINSLLHTLNFGAVNNICNYIEKLYKSAMNDQIGLPISENNQEEQFTEPTFQGMSVTDVMPDRNPVFVAPQQQGIVQVLSDPTTFTMPKNNHGYVITDEKIDEGRKMYIQGASVRQVAEKLGISVGSSQGIRKGWKDEKDINRKPA